MIFEFDIQMLCRVNKKIGDCSWEDKLGSAALMVGLVGNICLAFLFFPVSRGSSVLRLVGLTSEASIKYHIWLGHMVMGLFTAHGLCYIIFWAKTSQISQVIVYCYPARCNMVPYGSKNGMKQINLVMIF